VRRHTPSELVPCSTAPHRSTDSLLVSLHQTGAQLHRVDVRSFAAQHSSRLVGPAILPQHRCKEEHVRSVTSAWRSMTWSCTAPGSAPSPRGHGSRQKRRFRTRYGWSFRGAVHSFTRWMESVCDGSISLSEPTVLYSSVLGKIKLRVDETGMPIPAGFQCLVVQTEPHESSACSGEENKFRTLVPSSSHEFTVHEPTFQPSFSPSACRHSVRG